MKTKCKYCGQPFPYHTADCPVISTMPRSLKEWIPFLATLVGCYYELAKLRKARLDGHQHPMHVEICGLLNEQLKLMEIALDAKEGSLRNER